MSLFYIDPLLKKAFTYNELISGLNGIAVYNKYCYSEDYYLIFQRIIYSLITDQEIILLDYDFTPNELSNLTGFEVYEELNQNSKIIKPLLSKEELIERIQLPKTNWRLTLYTSGTTGLPKRVSHSFEGITRFVKRDLSHKNDTWGFAYNPTHMAGVQVFFQALLNGNSIVRLFKVSNGDIFDLIETYNISHISASPTFYNLLFNKEFVNKNVKRVTVGGEAFNDGLRLKLKNIFPNAKITNIYASTELGTLLASDGEYFTINSNFANLIKIIDGELFVSKSLLGETDNVFGNYYATGDLIEIHAEDPLKFKFIGRKNEMINVGGYKVNPIEVEEAIKLIEGIEEALVYSKKNSVTGNIICSDVVLKDFGINEAYIRNKLRGKLQEFKIPRIINLVDQIMLTRTGKVKR